jgi:Secretion system C-terminal sorting domain
MRFSTIILLITLFCLTLFGAIHFKGNKETKSISYNENSEYLEGPQEFIKFHNGIRTPEGADKPEYKKGYLLNELRKAKLEAAAFKKDARTEASGVLEWTERGPANVPGRTRGLAVDPADPTKNTWFACSVGGGVWKTTNAGAGWTLITPDLPNLATTVIAMAESNPNVIYIGTGEGFGNLDGIRGNGMFKSMDKGQTWAYLSSTVDFSDVNRAIIDPTNENIVIVATNDGIYKTIDGGTGWTKTSDLTFIQDLKATPGNFNIQYGTRNSVGVIKSTDAGATWNLSNTGMAPLRRIEIAISPKNTSRIFASCELDSSSKLMLSNDGGLTWSLVNVSLTTTDLDFLNGQGWYDNIITCDPFDQDVVYFGGVDLFRLKLTGGSTATGYYTLTENQTATILALTNFQSASNGNFDLGPLANNLSIEIKFGPGKSQKAHRFLVPAGSTVGVPADSYTYTDYVTVPFEVWDVTNNKQLMASFRDQGRDGNFNLIPANTDNTTAALQSREYLFVNNVPYSATTPSSNITVNGGHEFSEILDIWPTLAAGGVWPPTTDGTLQFTFTPQQKLNATTVFITDQRSQYGDPNKNSVVHPDHHNIVMVPITATTYKIINANDGGVYVSNTSATPGINNGNWTFAGGTYNTTQFYGADKRPGFDEYVGGAQDNGTWLSPRGSSATKTTAYSSKIGGDGFEAVWHNLDDKKIIGGSQFNGFSRTIDGGTTWTQAISGLNTNPNIQPFISKLANSRENPETLFTLSSEGVYRSTNFGGTWTLIPITEKWGATSSFMDVEVSRANASIIWAGSGMVNSGSLRNIHVSTNGGTSFTLTNNYEDVTLGAITKLASHPTEQKTAYATFSFAGKPKILQTNDLGQTWADITGFGTNNTSSNGFPDVAVFCVYVRPDDPNIIWAGTEIGIVESVNKGESWVLLDDFPHVAVWDLKGLDDQIIIATHGRGIWSAKMSNLQENQIKRPSILAAGTSPQSDFKLKILLQEKFDSTQVFINNQKVGKLLDKDPGEYFVKIKNVAVGNVEVKLIGFKDMAPFYSAILNTKKLQIIKTYQQQYSNVFSTATDFSQAGLSLQPFGNSNQSLQSSHNYVSKTESSATLLQPIIVSSTNSNFFYQDVVLVQPSAAGVTFSQPGFKDYVVVEGTTDGLTWIPLKDGYNASANAGWLAAHTANQPGTQALSVDQTIDLKNKFGANDTLLFRFRLKADADATTGWGWSIDNIFIQQTPTGIEPTSIVGDFSCFPNPTTGKVTIQYALKESSNVDLYVTDATGKSVFNQALGLTPSGAHETDVDLGPQGTGVYLIKLRSSNGEKIGKVIVKK